jgi:hypothetical protein
MSFDSIERSQASGEPWEAYLFQTTGKSFLYTSADVEIVYLGQHYVPMTIHRDGMEETAEVNSGEIKVYVPNSDPLAQLFLPGLPPAPVQLTIFAGHFGDTDVVAFFGGSVYSGSFTDECELVCRSDKYLLNRKIPKELYQGLCNHIFGDPGCGINLALHTYMGVVGTIDSSGMVLTVATFAAVPGGQLKGGYFRVGNIVRAILTHSGSAIRLMSPIAGLNVASPCTAIAGCAHTYPACLAYENVPNFLGFDLIPSINPFDGSTSLG